MAVTVSPLPYLCILDVDVRITIYHVIDFGEFAWSNTVVDIKVQSAPAEGARGELRHRQQQQSNVPSVLYNNNNNKPITTTKHLKKKTEKNKQTV